MPRFIIAFFMGVLAIAATSCSGLQLEAPVLTEETGELETLLSEMPWVSAGGRDAKVVYQFSFRTCPPCIQFKKEAWPILEDAGIETRLVMTARRRKSTEAERTAVVELARTRDWKMAQAWMKANSPNGYYKKMSFTAADGNKPREADLEKLRSQIDMLDEILAVNGIDMAYPTVLWQDRDNIWHAMVGYYSGMANSIITSMSAG